jgi:hypothetical protein
MKMENEGQKMGRIHCQWTVVLLLLRLRTNHIDALAIEAWPTLACMISLIGVIFIGGIDEDVRERTII